MLREFLPPCSLSCIRGGWVTACVLGSPHPALVLISWGKAWILLTPLQALLPASHLTSWFLFSSPYLFLFHISLSFPFLFLAFCWCLSHQPSDLEELAANPLWCWILQSSKYYYALSNVKENIIKEMSILKLSIESLYLEKNVFLVSLQLKLCRKRMASPGWDFITIFYVMSDLQPGM